MFEQFDPKVFTHPPKYQYSKDLTPTQNRAMRRKRRRYRLRKLKRAMIRAGVALAAA